MANIRFEDEREFMRQRAARAPQGLIGLVQKWGLAKDAQSAKYALLIIAGIAIGLSIYIYNFLGPEKNAAPIRPASQQFIPGP